MFAWTAWGGWQAGLGQGRGRRHVPSSAHRWRLRCCLLKTGLHRQVPRCDRRTAKYHASPPSSLQILRSNLGSVVLQLKKLGIDDLVSSGWRDGVLQGDSAGLRPAAVLPCALPAPPQCTALHPLALRHTRAVIINHSSY